MRLTRRDLLNTGLLGAAGLPLMSSLGCSQTSPPGAAPSSQAGTATSEPFVDTDTLSFWTSTAREPLEKLPDGLPTVVYEVPQGRNASYTPGVSPKSKDGRSQTGDLAYYKDTSKPPTTIANSSAQAAFVFYDDKNGFQPTARMTADGLLDKGDTTIVIDVKRVRPSIDDRAKFDNLKGGSLRIDLVQNTALPTLGEKLAWTTIAGLHPDAKGKLPAPQELSFDPSTAWGGSRTVTLPGGTGLWRWNFFLQKEGSRWGWFIRNARAITAPISVAFALPAYAATALADLDAIFGAVQASDASEWLLRAQSMRVSTTKAGFQDGHLPLRSGRYLAVSERQLHLLDGATFNGKPLELSPEGLIVAKETSGLSVFKNADQVLPELSYLSIQVTVSQAKPAA